MLKLLSGIPLCLLLCCARAQIVNYNASGKVRVLSSFLVLKLDTVTVQVQGAEQTASLLPGLIAPAIDLGVALIGEAIKHGPAKYSSVLSAGASGAGFWLTDRQVSLPRLSISRMIIPASTGIPETAFTIVLIPELSADRTAFRYQLKDSFEYRYAGVKTVRRFDFVNMEIVIRLRALTVSAGEYKLAELRSSSVQIPAMRAGHVYIPSDINTAGGWFPFPPKPSFEVETEKASETLRTVATLCTANGRPDNDTLTTLTRTIDKKSSGIQVIGQRSGNYEITVEVIEINPYKGRAVEREKVANAGLEPLSDVLKAAMAK